MVENKIFICFPDFSGGGAEKVMITMAKAFSGDNDASCVVLSGDGPLAQRMPSNCKLHNLGCASASTAILAVARLFNVEKPDIILSTLAYFNFVVIAAMLFSYGRPARIVVREANSPEATLASLPKRWIGKFCYKFLYNRADAIICNAQFIETELIGLGVNAKLINVIPNPVDVEYIRELSEKKTTFLAFSDPALPLFVAVGRLTNQKGMDRLIIWVGAMKMKANLLIIGDGPCQAKLDALIKKKCLTQRVRVMNYQDNPFPFMAMADAVLLGSRWEGLPNVALEALALGKTVVAPYECKSLVQVKSLYDIDELKVLRSGEAFVAELDKISQNKNHIKKACKSNLMSVLPREFHLQRVVEKYRALIFGY